LSLYRYTYEQWMEDRLAGPYGGYPDECHPISKDYNPWYTAPYSVNPAPIAYYGLNQTIPAGALDQRYLQENQTGAWDYNEYTSPSEMYRRLNPYRIISRPPIHAFVSFEQRMRGIINGERQKAGKHSLSRDQRLTGVAIAKARDMAAIGRCPAEHYSPTFGGDEGKMLSDAGISAANFGWIIYCGQPGTASEAVNWWMNISTYGHRENILNSSFNRMGVGTAVSQDGRRYWSVIFSS
jgi:uncharacterized protein YkwD